MFKLPDLPYAYDALSPVISETTLRTHHDKHHAKYVETVNDILAEHGARPVSLEDVIREAVSGGQQKLINNAGQAWNHALLWESMAPAGGDPKGALRTAIETAFGGLDGFKSDFVEQAAAHFGSGWIWLVAHGDKLALTTTHDGGAILPGADVTPILTCDLWEHAYYLDYKNDREAYLKSWIGKLANWDFAEAQLRAVSGAVGGYRYPAPMAKAA
jgi:Fe-Mn family superoxide dismutase